MPVEVQQGDEIAETRSEPIFAAAIGPNLDSSLRLELALAREPPEMVAKISETSSGPVLLVSLPFARVYVAPFNLSQKGVLRQIEALSKRLSESLVLVVGADTSAGEMRAALRAGAAGLVREPDIDSSLAETVRAVGAGQLTVPLELGRQIERPVLSRRQKQVLGLVVLGLSNGEIAAKLHLSEHTVKCHLYASFRKLNVNSRDAAVSLILDPAEGLGTGILAISGSKPSAEAPRHRDIA